MLHEFRFTSIRNKGIARIDFGLKLLDFGYCIPEHVELEELGETTTLYGTTPTYTIMDLPLDYGK